MVYRSGRSPEFFSSNCFADFMIRSAQGYFCFLRGQSGKLGEFKYVKRLLNRYRESGELSERLILNHLIVIFNVFGFPAGLKMLEFKIEHEHWSVLKPFLIFLKAIDEHGYPEIEMDQLAVDRMREIRRI